MVTTIGIDPHKATHTAVAIDGSEQVLAEITVPADRDQARRLVGGLPSSMVVVVCGRLRLPAGSDICCPSSSSPAASRWLMSRRCWHRGFGCCHRAADQP